MSEVALEVREPMDCFLEKYVRAYPYQAARPGRQLNQVAGSAYAKTRLLVLPTFGLTTLNIPADVSVAPAGRGPLLAASPKMPPRRTPAGSVIDMSSLALDSLELNTSHGEGSHAA